MTHPHKAMQTIAWVLLCKAKSQGLISWANHCSSTILSLFIFCAVNSVSTGRLLHFPVETCHYTEVAVCKRGGRRKPNVIQLLTLILYLKTHDSPRHSPEVFPTCSPMVPRGIHCVDTGPTTTVHLPSLSPLQTVMREEACELPSTKASCRIYWLHRQPRSFTQ